MSSTGRSVTQTVTEVKKKEEKQIQKKKIITPRNVVAVVCLLLAVGYVALAASVRFSGQLQSHLIYLHYVRRPLFGNLSNPSEFNLKNTRNFDLIQYDGCPVSTWHLLPDTYPDNFTDFTSALSDGAPIILYLHGNTGSRATHHRVETYQMLTSRGYHVIAFDYRGYGDSQCTPTERGLMEDALLEWDWVISNAPHSPVFLWGHSLGSAATTHLAREIWTRRHVHPKGIILDAPFPSMIDAASNHPFGIPYWPVMKIFRYLVLESFHERFESESRLHLLPYPLLFAHGHEDIIIPFHLGQKMYQTALEGKRRNPVLCHQVHFVDCGHSNHKTNFKSRNLWLALDYFIDRK